MPKLDFDRLTEIKERVNIPLVLHGSSGVPDEALREAVARGVRIIIIATYLSEAFTEVVREVSAANPNEIDPRKILGPAREKMAERVAEKIRIFGSNGKA